VASTPATIAFGSATLVEVLGYYIPFLDHVLDTIATPARSLGPVLMTGGRALARLWLFVAAPIDGAVMAAAVWRPGCDKE
jgi:glycerol uptake facilitator-like aquaporin